MEDGNLFLASPFGCLVSIIFQVSNMFLPLEL